LNTLPTVCPFCGGEVHVTHLYCRECDSHIEGHFAVNALSNVKPEYQAFFERFVSKLSEEQLSFVETFVRCEGRINRMETELGLSYPTIRNRLNEVVTSLGYEVDEDETTDALSNEKRLGILEDLDAGRISAEDAMRMLESEA
jgi:hypothetical protein